MSSPVAKKMKSTKVIGTHSGTFHCDVDPLDIVVDVGGVYDPAKQRYDHHQRGFTEVFGFGGFDRTKLSSAGLVYKHFGKHIIAKQLGVAESDPKVETLWLQLYGELIESIDGIDNGVNIAQGELAYAQRTDLSSRVRRLNPRWNEPASDDDYDARFAVASKTTGDEFLQQLDYFANAWLPARDVVKEALEKRHEVDPSGKIVVFKQDHLFSLEPTMAKETKILYVLYPENPDNENSKWRIQCVPESPDSFTNRKSLPAAWRGLRDEELSKESGIPGGVFVHASGFIGGNETFNGVLAMARAALNE
ncbi:GAMM1 protein [Trichosporon asahii var. asahii CBS 2479]|uniref:GAMM1 protein n=1 Tax=Trichosporon asahii var. asahii (strain ATCC 90039 / CBS 2479 / JCM 2466 / KCTC 7840 / NBRC 103889/ NCYC 2677 / UAMH 7654) TaxID=1186058 RepID=J6F1W2_TRIAS|nr:GAMM1 protein [Trichosporon asahii var. asahii CBS 2479]EJT50954.1 GAMM1 protein [Trichosporon asahii var. asahii CBS 2479]